MEDKKLTKEEIAFLQGAKWWEWRQTKFTMWTSDQQLVLEEAARRLNNKTLGKLPEE